MTMPEFRLPPASTSSRRYVQLPLSSPRTGAVIPGGQCQLHGANFRVVCASPSAMCQGPKCYGPSGKSILGWHACRHLDQYINVVPGPDGRRFTVDRRRSDRINPGEPVGLHELESTIVVNWAEDRLLNLANQTSVAAFLTANGITVTGTFEIPVFRVVESCEINVAGRAYGDRLIEISSWMLHDYDEAGGVLRHELAHIIVKRYGLRQPDSHGENFINALKAIAPLTWERDRHWHGTPAINQARSLIHPDATPVLPYTGGGGAGQA